MVLAYHFRLKANDWDQDSLESCPFFLFAVCLAFAVNHIIPLPSEETVHEKQSAVTLESVQRNLEEDHRVKEAAFEAELEQHRETIRSDQDRIANFKESDNDLSEEIKRKSNVIEDLRAQLKSANERNPATNTEDLVTLSEQHKKALEAARQEIAELKSARDLAVVPAPALPVATAATDPAAPSMGEHQRLLAEKTKLQNDLQFEKRLSSRKDLDLAAKDATLAERVTQQLRKQTKKLRETYDAELAVAKENQVRELRLECDEEVRKRMAECDEQVRQRMVECDEKFRQRMVELDQKHEQRMAGLKQEYDTDLEAAASSQKAALANQNVLENRREVARRVAAVKISYKEEADRRIATLKTTYTAQVESRIATITQELKNTHAVERRKLVDELNKTVVARDLHKKNYADIEVECERLQELADDAKLALAVHEGFAASDPVFVEPTNNDWTGGLSGFPTTAAAVPSAVSSAAPPAARPLGQATWAAGPTKERNEWEEADVEDDGNEPVTLVEPFVVENQVLKD